MALTHSICQTKNQNISGFIYLFVILIHQQANVFLCPINVTGTMPFNFQGVYHFKKL